MKTSVPSLALVALAALVALGGATGCRTYIPFTQELRDGSHLSEADLRNLQYYVSNTITLRREVDAVGGAVTGNHKLIGIGGKNIEEVVVESQTPGVCVGSGPHSMFISFEQGTFIEFTPLSGRSYAPDSPGFANPPPLDPFPGNRPSPVVPRTGDNFLGSYIILINNQNSVKFMGRSFNAAEETAQVSLLVDSESLDAVKRRMILPGLKLQIR